MRARPWASEPCCCSTVKSVSVRTPRHVYFFCSSCTAVHVHCTFSDRLQWSRGRGARWWHGGDGAGGDRTAQGRAGAGAGEGLGSTGQGGRQAGEADGAGQHGQCCTAKKQSIGSCVLRCVWWCCLPLPPSLGRCCFPHIFFRLALLLSSFLGSCHSVSPSPAGWCCPLCSVVFCSLSTRARQYRVRHVISLLVLPHENVLHMVVDHLYKESFFFHHVAASCEYCQVVLVLLSHR